MTFLILFYLVSNLACVGHGLDVALLLLLLLFCEKKKKKKKRSHNDEWGGELG